MKAAYRNEQNEHILLQADYSPALDMQYRVLLYIKQGLEAQLRTFSPNIIIEDQYL